ncbi:MAG: chemotaxis-specific protein-glutamate methyltransferase CheB, partial [Spirochaetaceae bacterium]
LMRKIIRTIFEKTADIEVAGTAMNGYFGLHKMESLDPDVIILDLEMPEMNGLDFLEEKKKRGNQIPVIILSSVAKKGAQVTMHALALGASDFLLKPTADEANDVLSVSSQLVELVRVYASREKKNKKTPIIEEKPHISVTKIPEPQPPVITRSAPKRSTAHIDIIAIGISTGGPNALRMILAHVRDDFDVPILVVQHMPKGFTEEFANSLNKVCPLEVKEAAEGDLIKPGRVLVAPGDRHILILEKPLSKIVHLEDSPPVNGHKPSVGTLFLSVAHVYQNHCIAIIMTGMGKDGASEIGSIYDEGGFTVAQDASSCVVYGMPKAAVEQGNIHRIISIDEMAAFINSVNKKPLLTEEHHQS